MTITIRPLKEEEFLTVYHLVTESFKEEVFSDHQEQFLVQRLLKSSDYLPELTLVAVDDQKICGFIQFSPLKIANLKAVALAPLAVLPSYQHQGIGRQLIQAADVILQANHYHVSVVLGHLPYYSKFGYERADIYHILPTFEVPKENFMVKVFRPFQLEQPTVVSYASAFQLD